jgi:excisionase family DNA binding protein
MSSAILTLEELATYLKLPAETIRDQADRGQIPGRKIGDDWRFLPAAIDDWLRADTHHSHAHHDHAHHDHELDDHELDDNRPIFPAKAEVYIRRPVAMRADAVATPENPWAAFVGVNEDDDAFLEIAAELRSEDDLENLGWVE